MYGTRVLLVVFVVFGGWFKPGMVIWHLPAASQCSENFYSQEHKWIKLQRAFSARAENAFSSCQKSIFLVTLDRLNKIPANKSVTCFSSYGFETINIPSLSPPPHIMEMKGKRHVCNPCPAVVLWVFWLPTVWGCDFPAHLVQLQVSPLFIAHFWILYYSHLFEIDTNFFSDCIYLDQ